MRTARISADEARALRKDHLRGDALLKVAATAPASWSPAARSARFVMTKEIYDRYGDIVIVSGLDTSEFEMNPQAFLNHNSSSWPIGKWANLAKVRSTPPRLEGDLVLGPAGGPIPEIDQAAWSIANGLMRACSIGFLPNWDQVEKVLGADGSWSGGLRFNSAELIEASLVGLPANTGAMAKSALRRSPSDAANFRMRVEKRKRQLEREVLIAKLRRGVLRD
jgi:hypothetical protein